MKTLTTLIRKAAARWVLKHRVTRQAQPEPGVPEEETMRETANDPVPEKREMKDTAGSSGQVSVTSRQAGSSIVDMERRQKAFLADRYRFRYNPLRQMKPGDMGEFHPFRACFTVLPVWDGQNHITDPACRISDCPP